MVDLVTVAEVKTQRNILDTYSDALIETTILQASAIVMNFLKKQTIPDEWISNTAVSPVTYDIPYEIRAAVFLVVGELMENREASVNDVLSQGVRDLLKLSPYWDATIA